MTEKELLKYGYRKYYGKTIDVFFKKEKCIKSGNCVKGEPNVFDTSRKSWILPDKALKEDLKDVINTYPSGALKNIERVTSKFLFENGRFYLEDKNKKTIAEITYTNANEILIIDHTFVDASLRGKGIAAKLVDSVVKLAIDEEKKIIPLCPYAKKILNDNEAYKNILYK